MKILVFGKTGQVATELQRLGSVVALGRDQADLRDPEACAQAIRLHQPDAVINAAAYTAVDKAEDEESLAFLVNGEAPAAMARASAELAIPLVHISTDYVFSGEGIEPWQPADQPSPVNAYGRSKLAGENGVRAAGGPHAILRTSWVVSAHGNNFIKTMLRLGAERETLNIVDDQTGGPTPAADIAEACLDMARKLRADPQKSGTYHFSGSPDTSWASFAREIFAQAGLGCQVNGIPTAEYPTPAKRPLNSRLDCASTKEAFNISRPDWRQGLGSILKDLT